MEASIKFYLSDFGKEKPANGELITKVEAELGFAFPKDYVEILKTFNGGEDEIGQNGWLVLFPIEDLIITNIDYQLLMEQIPDYFLFGKDAADTGFAFHKENKTCHSFGLMSDFRVDTIEFCGNSFEEFLAHLYNQ
jgi:hypothetical protein